MKVESSVIPGVVPPLLPAPVESVEHDRKEPALLSVPSRDEKKVAPEEILDRIKALTENGIYSVRFEKSDKFDSLIIRLVDSETGEVIRQIPQEELLKSSKFLKELRGSMIDTES